MELLTAKSHLGNHQSTGMRDQNQENNDIAINTMEQLDLMPDRRHELEQDQKRGNDDTEEVNTDPDIVSIEVEVIVAFTGTCLEQSIGRLGVAEDAVEV